jgi:5'-deoxynucleotidase YfbR-like HD superfamily hydrolase
MSELLIKKVEHYQTLEQSPEADYPTTASIALELGSIAMRFARVERVPRYDEKTRESDVEHSYMLALVASELAHSLYPNELNSGKIMEYAIVHDLIELKTGDVATFQLDEETLLQKEATEHAALESLLAELPPHTRDLLYNYEQQADKEARFVRAVDKLLPIVVDILGSGHKVMREDYNVHQPSDLTQAHDGLQTRMADRFSEFPQIVEDHSLLCELFEIDFGTTHSK